MKTTKPILKVIMTFVSVIFCTSVLLSNTNSSNSVSEIVPEALTGFGYPLIGSFSNNGGYSFLTLANYSGNNVYHPGEDWNQPGVSGGCGTGCNSDMCLNVVSTAIGQVVYANSNSWGGVVLQHNYQGQTWYSQYGHVRNILVSIGQIVSKGQKIAEVGNQGNIECAHLHFEIRKSAHPDPLYGAFFPYGNSGLGNINNVLAWYENPGQFISSHPAYNNNVTASFTVNNGNSINGWKFWKSPPIPANLYNVSVNIQNLPNGSYWALYITNGNTIIEPIATNQSISTFNFPFSVSASNGSYPNGGGYKFILTPQGQSNIIWAQSSAFYISSIPQIQLSVTPFELITGQSGTVSWTVTGGIPGLPYGGLIGNIILQFHQNGNHLQNLVSVPISNNSFTFTVPTSIPGATIPGCGFQISASNTSGSSIPEGYVYGFSNSFCINILTNVIHENGEIPAEFNLYQNFPNPFNPYTSIKFDLPEGFNENVSIKIFNINGEEISSLLNNPLLSGKYEIKFDGSELPSGVYWYKLTSPSFSRVRAMILLK